MSGTWLFFILSLLVSVTPAEFSAVVGLGPVQASVGEDVVLPCRLNPPFDVSTLTVEWTRDGHTVHVYKGRPDVTELDEQFRGRTSLFHHELSRGNISLKLSNITEEDSGLYFCYVPKLQSQVKRGNVLLSVYRHPSPVQASAGEDVVLPCHLNPPFNVSSLTVEWKRDDRIVHVYKDRKHDHPQDEQFRGRTSLFPEELSRGNISLKLTNVTEKDSGLYVCYVPRLESTVKRGNVLLTVLRGNAETQNGNKQSTNQSGAIAAFVVVAVIIVLVLVIVWKHKDTLETWWDGRWGRNQENDPQREPPNNEEENRLNPGPGPIPQGADPVELDPLNPNPDQISQDADAQ